MVFSFQHLRRDADGVAFLTIENSTVLTSDQTLGPFYIPSSPHAVKKSSMKDRAVYCIVVVLRLSFSRFACLARREYPSNPPLDYSYNIWAVNCGRFESLSVEVNMPSIKSTTVLQ